MFWPDAVFSATSRVAVAALNSGSLLATVIVAVVELSRTSGLLPSSVKETTTLMAWPASDGASV